LILLDTSSCNIARLDIFWVTYEKDSDDQVSKNSQKSNHRLEK